MLTFYGCDNNKNLPAGDTLIKVDSLILPLYDSISDPALEKIWNYDDHSISFLKNDNELILYRYFWKNKRWNTVCFNCFDKYLTDKPGPFSFLNDSCIIMGPKYTGKILLIDIKNKTILEKYKLPVNYAMSPVSPISLYYDSLSIFLPVWNNSRINSDFLRNSYLIAKINRLNGSIELISKLPKDFIIKSPPLKRKLIIPGVLFIKDKVVLNFQKENKVYIKSLSDTVYTGIEAGNPNIVNNYELRHFSNDIQEAFSDELSGNYKRLLFDDRKKTFYRISVFYPDFKGEIPNDINEMKKLFEKRKIMISAFDSNFNNITNPVIAGYSDLNCFVFDGKLYLRSEINSENIIKFFSFKVLGE